MSIKTVAAASALAVAATLTLSSAPAAADTPNCVTRAEFRKAKKGMTKPRVHRIFDIDGRRMSIAESGGYKSEIRSYRACSKYSSVVVSWDKKPDRPWRLAAKSAVWVS